MNVSDVHQRDFSCLPEAVVTVYGVLKLVGGFADYCKGSCLCACTSKYLSVGYSPRQDGIVRLTNSFGNEHKRFNTSSIKFRQEDKWANYVKGILSYFYGKGTEISGMDLSFEGPLLKCDSETVSTSIGVSVCLLLNKVLGLSLDKKTIARIVYSSCSLFCNERCSISSIVTMLEAKSGYYAAFDLLKDSFTWVSDPFVGSEYTLLLIDSRISSSVITEELDSNYSIVSKAAEKFKANCHTPMRDFPESELRSRSFPLSESDRRVCLYIITEYHCVRQIQKAFESLDFTSVGKNILKLRSCTNDNLELSCPELDWIMKRCGESIGVIGSVAVYGAATGCIATVVRRNAVDSLKTKLEDYEHIFGFKIFIEEFTPHGNI